MTSIANDQLPTRADLDAATARTAAVLACRPPQPPERTACAPPRWNKPCTTATCSVLVPTPSCRPKPNWRQPHDHRDRARPAVRRTRGPDQARRRDQRTPQLTVTALSLRARTYRGPPACADT